MAQKPLKYCTGCGLCHSVLGVPFEEDEKNFLRPVLKGKQETIQRLETVCPFGSNGVSEYTGSVWGYYESVYRGYSSNEDIRFKASSGGVITALCAYLLDKHIVDGIILTKADTVIPYHCDTFCARTIEEVKSACGSRYSQSSPLFNIKDLIEENEKYCFVGKPCDVAAFRRYLQNDSKLRSQIYCMFSFFCAGMPSDAANEKLISELGCKKCSSLRYRGYGWPGNATAIDIEGKEYSMDYQSSWMNILGRDIRKSCKLCFDGIGEFADISCGDIWELTNDKKPVFTESNGYNIIFARTVLGKQLIESAVSAGSIQTETWAEKIGDLRYCQPNHFLKRTTILSKCLALRCMFRDAPRYKVKRMLQYSKNVDLKTQFSVFKGTVIRILRNKL